MLHFIWFVFTFGDADSDIFRQFDKYVKGFLFFGELYAGLST